MKRRDIIKSISLLPFMGSAIASLVPTRSSGSPGDNERSPVQGDLFKELDVTPIINITITMTFLSGSRMLPEVMQAINSTSHNFANMYELQDKVGNRIAEMLNCEAAMVTSGAAGAMTVGTAGCITRLDKEKISLLPNLPDARKEVIMQKSHQLFLIMQFLITA